MVDDPLLFGRKRDSFDFSSSCHVDRQIGTGP